jgi:hypothetical protein
MEYEIEDDALLFDDSTNPSLEHNSATRARPPVLLREVPANRRRLQKAEVIPEEEPA